MHNPVNIGETIEALFRRILHERMQGLPLLNPAIEVEAVGFQYYENRVMGIIITPWLMNLVLLPGRDDQWDDMQLGDKQWHEIGTKKYKFIVNEIDDFGICQTHSLHSPMHAFDSHQSAVRAAQEFFARLDDDTETADDDCIDEEFLGRLMRDEIPDEIDFEAMESAIAELDDTSTTVMEEKRISRRALLRGNLG